MEMKKHYQSPSSTKIQVETNIMCASPGTGQLQGINKTGGVW